MKRYIRYILKVSLCFFLFLSSGCSNSKDFEVFRTNRVVVEIGCGSQRGNYLIVTPFTDNGITEVIKSIEGFDGRFEEGYRYQVELSKVVSVDGKVTYKFIDIKSREECTSK